MPNPKNFKSQKDFMKSCVSEVVKEGKSQDQAVAQCMSMWRNRNKSKGLFDRVMEALKERLQNGSEANG